MKSQYYYSILTNHKTADRSKLAERIVEGQNQHTSVYRAEAGTNLSIQLNKYETAPDFIQRNQSLTSDCLLI